MKFLFALTMVSMSIATNAIAGQLEYELEVNGMVCAFCAYNVSKQLKTLDGVIPDSVDVDLNQGTVRLRSENKLDRIHIADLLLTAGFRLETVSEAVALTAQPRRNSDEAVLLNMSIDSDSLSDGQIDAVLEAIGAIAADLSARISIVGPEELELAILKPVLAGRKTVIEVEYDRMIRPDNTIRINLMVD